MISDQALRWVVTILFVLSAAECVYTVAIGDRRTRYVVGQALHFVMAVAMAVMVWPAGAALPTTAPMIFFLLATAWFVGVVFGYPIHRITNGYHALMMLAMVWMYAVMNGRILPGQGSEVHHHGADVATPMPGMDMPGMDAGGQTAAPRAGDPAWISAINWIWTVGFALAAVWWLYRYFAERRTDREVPAYAHLGTLGQVMMGAGMAIMFGVLL